MSMTMDMSMPSGSAAAGMPMSSMMSSSGMNMVFFTSTTTALYSMDWSPAGSGSYAGTCIFLVVLAIIFRGLLAAKASWDRKVAAKERGRRPIIVAGAGSSSNALPLGLVDKTDVLVAEKEGRPGSSSDAESERRGGSTAQLQPQQNQASSLPVAKGPAPWRISTELPRALWAVLISGVGYLLMLAVMTMNVGYFLSILAGVFVGELFVGRYAASY